MDKDNLKKILPVVICIIIVGGVLFYVLLSRNFKNNTADTSMIQSDEKASQSVSPNEQSICIYICGQVKKPGIYYFSVEPRVGDVIKQAGGTTKNADLLLVNQAAKVSDGEQITIFAKTKESTAQSGTGSGSGKVSINQATKEELMTLSGIGEGKAESIIKYRQDSGTFKKLEDLMKVPGIKEGVYQKLEDDISL